MNTIKDIQKCYQIINRYGSKGQKEAMDKLRCITYYRDEMDWEAYQIIRDIEENYMLKTANELYKNNKDDGNSYWFMKED